MFFKQNYTLLDGELKHKPQETTKCGKRFNKLLNFGKSDQKNGGRRSEDQITEDGIRSSKLFFETFIFGRK